MVPLVHESRVPPCLRDGLPLSCGVSSCRSRQHSRVESLSESAPSPRDLRSALLCRVTLGVTKWATDRTGQPSVLPRQFEGEKEPQIAWIRRSERYGNRPGLGPLVRDSRSHRLRGRMVGHDPSWSPRARRIVVDHLDQAVVGSWSGRSASSHRSWPRLRSRGGSRHRTPPGMGDGETRRPVGPCRNQHRSTLAVPRRALAIPPLVRPLLGHWLRA